MRKSLHSPSAKKPSLLRLTPALTRRIHAEAKALGLKPNEYLRLVLAIATHLRDGVGNHGTLQAKEMLALVENPLFGMLFSTVTQSLLKQQESSNDDNEKTERPLYTAPTPAVRPPQYGAYPYPGMMAHPGMLPGPFPQQQPSGGQPSAPPHLHQQPMPRSQSWPEWY